jgi:hypothetical protein
VEFVIAGIGLALAVWMILGARGRHRSSGRQDKERDG